MISAAQIFALMASAVIAIGLPIALLLIWRKLTHASYANAICGAIIFVVFAFVLEQIPHVLLLKPDGFIVQHTWAFVLYGAFAAGIFEETGRFLAFKVFLRKHNDRQDGIMYGIGHGGIESILLAGITLLSYIVLTLQYNSGAISDPSGTITSALQNLSSLSVGSLLMIGIERIIAICLHIALSVLVFQAAKRSGKLVLYPVAILLHALADVPAALLQRGIITNTYLLEGVTAVITAAICVFAAVLYFRDHPEREEPAAQPVPDVPPASASPVPPVDSPADAPAQPAPDVSPLQEDLSSVNDPINLSLDSSTPDVPSDAGKDA